MFARTLAGSNRRLSLPMDARRCTSSLLLAQLAGSCEHRFRRVASDSRDMLGSLCQLNSSSPERSLAALRAVVRDRGWAVTRVPSTSALIELASALGEIVPSHTGGSEIDELRPRPSSDVPKNSLSGVHGLGRFPYHTDAAHHALPPRLVILRLASKEPSERSTLVAPLPRRISQEARAILEHDVWVVNGGRGVLLTSLLSDVAGSDDPLLRFDEACMRPADRVFVASRQTLLQLIARTEKAVMWAPDRAIILDNWRTLHARSGAPRHHEDRVLERALVA